MTDYPKYTLGLVFFPGITSLDIVGAELVEKAMLFMQQMMPASVVAN
jgi:hypothetical protein